MKKTDYSWIWIGALSGLTLGFFGRYYSQCQMDQFNKEYQEKYKNGLQQIEARATKNEETTAKA